MFRPRNLEKFLNVCGVAELARRSLWLSAGRAFGSETIDVWVVPHGFVKDMLLLYGRHEKHDRREGKYKY